MTEQLENQSGKNSDSVNYQSRRERVVEEAKEHFRSLPEWRQEQAKREADAIRLGHEQTMKR